MPWRSLMCGAERCRYHSLAETCATTQQTSFGGRKQKKLTMTCLQAQTKREFLNLQLVLSFRYFSVCVYVCLSVCVSVVMVVVVVVHTSHDSPSIIFMQVHVTTFFSVSDSPTPVSQAIFFDRLPLYHSLSPLNSFTTHHPQL